MPLPIKSKPGLRRMLQETISETASSSALLRPALPPKRARKEGVKKNETMKYLSETKDELEMVRKTLLRFEEERDTWKRLFEDCNKKQADEIERLKQEYKERSERQVIRPQWKDQYLKGVFPVSSPR